MKTINFNPRSCNTYATRACNPCISNTYEKHRAGSIFLVPRGCSAAHPVGPLIRYERNRCKSVQPEVLFRDEIRDCHSESALAGEETLRALAKTSVDSNDTWSGGRVADPP